MKKGESKTIAFLIKRNGVALDMSALDPAPSFKWGVKRQREDSDYILEKEDIDFDKTDVADGYVKINVSAIETAGINTGTYMSELKCVFSASDIDKSANIPFTLEKSVIHD
jgi:hypothetical protein